MTQLQQIKAEIKKQLSLYTEEGSSGVSELKHLLTFIELLEKQQPQGLDEAAKEYVEQECSVGAIRYCGAIEDVFVYSQMVDMFKTGVEWMAEQGETFETTITNVGIISCPKLNISAGKKVIVQIREKED